MAVFTCLSFNVVCCCCLISHKIKYKVSGLLFSLSLSEVIWFVSFVIFKSAALGFWCKLKKLFSAKKNYLCFHLSKAALLPLSAASSLWFSISRNNVDVKGQGEKVDKRAILRITNPCPLIFRFCGSFFVEDLYVILHIASKTSSTSCAEQRSEGTMTDHSPHTDSSAGHKLKRLIWTLKLFVWSG